MPRENYPLWKVGDTSAAGPTQQAAENVPMQVDSRKRANYVSEEMKLAQVAVKHAEQALRDAEEHKKKFRGVTLGC